MELGSLTKGRVWETGEHTALIFEPVSGEEDAHSYARGYSATRLAIRKKRKKFWTHILTLSRSKEITVKPSFCVVEVCNFQTEGRGSTSMAQSIKIFGIVLYRK